MNEPETPGLHFNRLAEWPGLSVLEASLIAAARAALATGPLPRDGEVSFTFVPDVEMRSLNRSYRGHDAPTDVLAFDLGSGEELLGDVYICPAEARRRAEQWEVPYEEELLRLVVHGVLHLLGHKHPAGEGRLNSPMFRLQEDVLRRLRE